MGMPWLLWRLALHPRLGLSLAELLRMPVRALLEAELMADIFDRQAADRAFSEALEADARDAVRAARGRR